MTRGPKEFLSEVWSLRDQARPLYQYFHSIENKPKSDINIAEATIKLEKLKKLAQRMKELNVEFGQIQIGRMYSAIGKDQAKAIVDKYAKQVDDDIKRFEATLM